MACFPRPITISLSKEFIKPIVNQKVPCATETKDILKCEDSIFTCPICNQNVRSQNENTFNGNSSFLKPVSLAVITRSILSIMTNICISQYNTDRQ